MASVIALIRAHDSAWIIKKTLDALSDCVDNIIVHDDNSFDDTVKICKSYSKVIGVFENKKTFYDEGIDKAILLNLGKKYDPDYFLFMDDDEVIAHPKRFRKLMTMVNINKKILYLFKLLYLWGNNKDVRIDGKWNNQLRSKLVRNCKELFIPMKKCHCSPETKDELIFVSDVPIIHYGYNSNKKINEKLELYNGFTEETNGLSYIKLKKQFNSKPEFIKLKEFI